MVFHKIEHFVLNISTFNAEISEDGLSPQATYAANRITLHHTSNRQHDKNHDTFGLYLSTNNMFLGLFTFDITIPKW